MAAAGWLLVLGDECWVMDDGWVGDGRWTSGKGSLVKAGTLSLYGEEHAILDACLSILNRRVSRDHLPPHQKVERAVVGVLGDDGLSPLVNHLPG